MRDRYEEVRATGFDVVAIGMGRVDMADHFRKEFDIPFRLLVDHRRETYRALDIKRGTWWDVLGPHMWWDFTKRMLKGQGPKGVQADPLQLGGVAVIETDGTIRKIHRASDPADNLPIDELLTILVRS